MIESSRMARLVDYFQVIGIAGFREYSESKMAPPCRREHVGEREVLLLQVPGSRWCDQILGGFELPDEPNEYEAIRPICKHGSTDNRLLSSTLRIGCESNDTDSLESFEE